MRQQRKVSVFPSKPETLEIYTIHTLKVKASPGFAAGTAELSISLSNGKSFLWKQRSQTQRDQGQGISTAHVAQAKLSSEPVSAISVLSLLSPLHSSSSAAPAAVPEQTWRWRCICKRSSQILFLCLIPCTQGRAWLSFTKYPRIQTWWEISL